MKFTLLTLSLLYSNLLIIISQEASPCKIYECLCIKSDTLINFIPACANTKETKCKAAGECIIQKDGQCDFTYTPKLQKCLDIANGITPVKSKYKIGECRPTGCGGSSCLDHDINMLIRCAYNPAYDCFKYAHCRKVNKVCVWKYTKKYNMCKQKSLLLH